MQKWISVKDELPKETGEYLTYNPSSFYQNIAVNTRYVSEWEHSDAFISHWMPLPEAPCNHT